MTHALIKFYSCLSCLSCESCGRATHRHGRTAWVCLRFGFDIDASTVPGETIGCDQFAPRTMLVMTAKTAEMPVYLL